MQEVLQRHLIGLSFLVAVSIRARGHAHSWDAGSYHLHACMHPPSSCGVL